MHDSLLKLKKNEESLLDPKQSCIKATQLYFALNMAKTLACIVFANSGCGKFQPINAPNASQNNVSNMSILPVFMLCLYLSLNKFLRRLLIC